MTQHDDHPTPPDKPHPAPDGSPPATPEALPPDALRLEALPRDAVPSDALPPDSLARLAARLQAFAAARDWGRFHAPKNLAAALVVEAGELLEPFQWLGEEESRHLPAETRAAVADEMADVLLYLVQLASVMQVDLLDAAWRKLARNEGRFPLPAGGEASGATPGHRD